MGIKGLTGLISDEAPSAIKEQDIKNLHGRRVAIDASMSLYQFLIAVRTGDGQQLMSESGETTSHLIGFLYRTLRMIDSGMKVRLVSWRLGRATDIFFRFSTSLMASHRI